MSNEERQMLILERVEIEQRMKGDFINPKDLRRVEEITSPLMSDGATGEIRLKAGKIRKSQRVTSFTRDRR